MMNLEQLLNFRRSVRYYDADKPVDSEKVKYCIELATLAPNSSNMQLWEFYQVTDKAVLKKLSRACMDQAAAITAQELVVFVTRRDLFRERSKANLNFETDNVMRNSPPEKQAPRLKHYKQYYGMVMPMLYSRFLRMWGLCRKLLVTAIGLFRPMVLEASESDMKVVVHKSCALAAQTFMLAMAEQGMDTCPMEGFDSRRVKNILNLPCGAEINMIISCGYRQDTRGIRGDRFRIPFDEVYRRI